MKNKAFYILIVLFMLLGLVSCGKPVDDDKDKKEISIECNILDGENITAGESKDIICTITNNEGDAVVEYSSSDETIFSIENEKILTKKVGSAKLTILLKDKNISKELTINVIKPTFDITFNGSYDYDLDENKKYNFEYTLSDKNSIVASNGFEFTSSDETVCKINDKNEITTLKEGKSTITIMSKWDNSYKYTVEVNVIFDPISVIESYNIDSPIYQNVKTFGNTEINQMVMGSINYYTPMPLNLVEKIIPITDNCPYAGQTATEELLLKAEGDNKYMRTGILHTETTKITYHDTGNNTSGATALMHANYMVGTYNQSNRARSWHYTVDDEEVIHHIPDNEVTWQGDNYLAYSTSIGIETCVDEGSELDITWHRTAKLMASLIKKYDMKITDVVQHYDWSGKNCPQTLRMNNLYSYAIKMIEAELTAITVLDGYDIKFTSLNPELVDDNGHIISIPDKATEVAYVVSISNENGYNKSKVLYTNIPGKVNNKNVDKLSNDIHAFYDSFNNLTIENYQDSFALYEKMSNDDKLLATGVDYLVNTLKEINGGSAPKLSIEEVYFGSKMRYQFIQLKNNTEAKVSLTNYSIVYTDEDGNKETFGFPQKSIEANSYFLINCAINESVDPNEVIYPDFALDLDLSKTGKIEIYKGETLVDSIEYSTNVVRVGYSKDMDKDLAQALINPINSLGEKYQEIDDVYSDIIDFETYALAINLPLTKDQSEKIKNAMDYYSTFDSIQKSKSRSYSYLKSLKTKCDGLK